MTYKTYDEARAAIVEYAQQGRRAVFKDVMTGGMRDVSAGFQILVEPEHRQSEQHQASSHTTRNNMSALPRLIAWVFMISAFFISIALVTDWIVANGGRALQIILIGGLGTAAAFLAAIMWSIVLSDLSNKVRK